MPRPALRREDNVKKSSTTRADLGRSLGCRFRAYSVASRSVDLQSALGDNDGRGRERG